MTRTDSTRSCEWRVVDEELEIIDGWEVLSEEIGGDHSYLIEYYKRCRRGEIVIGRELMTTLERLMQDILDGSGAYRFRLEEPHKRIRFIETEIKHFESPFAGKPFLLELNQKAIVEAVFGFFVYDEDLQNGRAAWVRRFKEVLLLVARKNGKTPFTAAMILSEWFCGEAGQKVMCASNDYEQAGLVFDCINSFREESRLVSMVTRKNLHGIFFGNYRQKRKTGKFSQQNKGCIKKMSARTGAKEGRNLKTVIVDEVHELKDAETVMPLRSSLTTQDEPLYFEITTEGVVRDGYLDHRLELARKVLRGEIEQPRWLIWLYTQDSESEVWEDERSWQKSNPLLGVCKKRSDLRDLVEMARINSAQRAFTLAKEFNVKQISSKAWLDEKYIQSDLTFSLEDFRGCWCLAGVDIGETNDLCAVTILLMRPGQRTKFFHTMYFVTDAKAGDDLSTDSPTNPEKKNYREWAREGLCRIIEGGVIGDEVAAEYLWEIYQTYGIRPYRVGYDQWHAKEFYKSIARHFGENVPVKVGMNPASLNIPTRMLEEDLRAGAVNYGANEICAWNLRNTAIKTDNHGWVMPEKISGYVGNKIDGTMTKVIALEMLRENRTDFLKKIGGA